ncbi:hypothetical protein OIU84_008055 [Salix udensis]|uniref:Uncharacterized protein n=1 Tax=Salix udensis TaxID=889485 RepID=A0AAD6JUD5_9ROSI|nr:hypothetical protein OIU84_008055 [Salix udensis]
MVSDVPLPTPGKDLVLFAIENSLLSVEAPPKDGLPHVELNLSCLLWFTIIRRWFEFDFLGMLEESTSNYVIDSWRGLHLDVFMCCSSH